MALRLALRSAGVASLVAAALMAVHAVRAFAGGAPAEDWQRLLARVLAACLFAAIGAAALRARGVSPPARRIRKVQRVVGILARDEVLDDYQESAPVDDLVDALARDWRAAYDALRPDALPLLAGEQAAALAALDAEITLSLPLLPAGVANPSLLRGHPAWPPVRARAAAALATFLPREGAGTERVR